MDLKDLNLLSSQHNPRRSSLTCAYKCGNACAGECKNTSANSYFGDIISRRGLLKVGGLSAGAIGGSAILAACAPGEEAAETATATATETETNTAAAAPESPAGMKFESIAADTTDEVTLPAGYESAVLIRWGDPLFEDAPEFDPMNQTAAAQERQFGFNNDFAGLMEHPSDKNRLVYVCSHEYTTEPHMFFGYDAENPTEEEVNTALAAHGHTILEVSKVDKSGNLKSEFGPLNRRITATTPFTLTGPAAGSELVRTSADPEGTTVLGTLNNCSGGVTPWGTFLSGEENVDQYFANAAAVTDERAAEDLKRMGFNKEESDRKWENYHDRFDLAKEPNEAHRFGYIVEIDPYDAESTPIKHTALGRFKHEAGTIYIADDGTVVCYSGDDERFEYIYKFISSRKVKEGDTAHNKTILDAGTLYVASLEGNSPEADFDGSAELPEDEKFDGTGTWHPLLTVEEDGSAKSHIDGFSPEEVAVYTRLAADKANPTKMDRPEDFEPNPATGKLYLALTNNKYRGATPGGEKVPSRVEEPTEYAPVKENKNGYVMEITDDHAGTEFTWDLLLVCGDAQEAYSYFGGFPKDKVSDISCPDNVAFDPQGNLWIATDGYELEGHDGLFAVALEGENRGETKRFMSNVLGAETCGPIVEENRVLFAIQHPGEMDDATAEEPGSHWPDGGDSLPRPAVVVAWKKDGGNIGEA